jgi:hypothetical protein
LAESCLQVLRGILDGCQSPHLVEYTPSDFPDVELSDELLEKALEEISF